MTLSLVARSQMFVSEGKACMQVLLGVLERGRDLASFQAPQGDAAGSCDLIPDM